MTANADPNQSTMAPAAEGAPSEEGLHEVEVIKTSDGVVVKWGEGGARQTVAGLDAKYTDDGFHATDANGEEPFRKTFGTLLRCNGGLLTIGSKRYTIQVKQQQQQASDESLTSLTTRLLPLMTALPDLFREVGISRRSRLNCWERESMRTSGSKRSKRFRRKVIDYYKRASNSGRSVKCQILDEYISNNEAEDEATGIIAAHIWKASTRGHGLEEFGLEPEYVNSARNGLFLTKGLEDALDNQQICFLYNLLEDKIVLWVADTSLMNKTIAGSGKTTSDGSDIHFSQVHQKPLLCPPNCLPFRRLLSWHARLTLESRPQTVDARRFPSTYDNSPGREIVVIDPINRVISELVEPGDDASVDHN